MKLKLCFLLLLCPFFGLCGQDKNIKIGEKVPDVVIGSVLNCSSKSLRLSDFKGKLLIIDFWATSCASCINAIPRLDSLQHEFGDRIAILGVSYEKAAVVRAFLTKNPIGKSMRLPVVTDDFVLAGLFQHHFISHEVWINESGVVVAITDPEYVDVENISAFLRHEVRNLPVKTDLADYDYHKPIVSTGAVFYSMIGPYKPGVLPRIGFERDTIAQTTRMYVVNSSILQLYLLALHQPFNLPRSRMLVITGDSSRIFIPPGTYTEAWNLQHSFCYESVLPGIVSNYSEKKVLLADLDRFFHLDGRMEKKAVKCLSLQRFLADDGLLASRGGVPMDTLHSNDAVKQLTACSLSQLTWELDNIPGGLPAEDDTGFKGLVDLKLQVPSLRNTAALNAALRPYGLVLKEVTRQLNVFVLADAADNQL